MNFKNYLKMILKENETKLIAPNGSKSNLSEKEYFLVRTPEFKKWFGDWEKGGTNVSKMIDENGEPLLMYHQTGSIFKVFDKTLMSSSKGDAETPIGIFLKKHNRDIGLKGKYQLELFVNLKKPMTFKDRDELKKYYSKNIKGWDELNDEKENINNTYQEKTDKDTADMYDELKTIINKDITPAEKKVARNEIMLKYDVYKTIAKWKEIINENSFKTRKLITDHFISIGCDGIIINKDEGSFNRETDAVIVFDSNQIKSPLNKGKFSTHSDNIVESLK